MDPDTGVLPAAEESLLIDQARVGEVVMLTCSDEVDSATAAQPPSATLDGLHNPNGGPIVIDMSEAKGPLLGRARHPGRRPP